MTTETHIPSEIAEAWFEYQTAKESRARWADQEKRLREKILLHLGYGDDNDQPEPMTALTVSGRELFKVHVGKWSGMDFNHLRDNYPQVYAECERSKPTMTLKPIT